MATHPLTLSFDIGHSSIGWAVLAIRPSDPSLPQPDPDILGCGTVTFPTNDCLASQRRTFRRMRRHIRATRHRIARLKKLLLHLGVLTGPQLDNPGHPAPFVLAARAIQGTHLTWQELWHVLRWYAHNRGYDGNRRWSKSEDDPDAEGDSEKERNAIELMRQHATTTMAETICAQLDINPNSTKASSEKPYRTLNAAFPREVVVAEVRRILTNHIAHLPSLDDAFITTLIEPDNHPRSAPQAWTTIPVPAIKLPRRYRGGLLFGQSVPRFDNRLISTCPISGEKVPNKATLDFLRYRWALLLANIRVDGNPLSADHRQHLDQLMQQTGRLTANKLAAEIEALTGSTESNIEATFKIHPDSEDALTLDPALEYSRNPQNAFAKFAKHLPESIRARATARWKKRRPVTAAWCLDQLASNGHSISDLDTEIDAAFTKDQSTKRPSYPTRDHLLRKQFAPKPLTGRAPFARHVMKQAVEFVLATDKHPTEVGGPLYRSEEVKQRERDRPIDQLTNNHLVRHRLKILLRLTDHIIGEFAGGDGDRITDIIVEVARDITEFSGKTAKDIASELNGRLRHFKAAVEHLEAASITPTGSLIRKCRIAIDLGWTCPFTGQTYDAHDLPKMDREHIIPYADRPTDALYAIVLTFPEVNKMKGRRTARQFIADHEGRNVDGSTNLTLLTLKQYDAFVHSLDTKGHPDDQKRKRRRRALLKVDRFERKDHGFTEGALTQTSHLNRLSARQLESRLPNATIHSIPGQVTAETRKAWNLLHALDRACPEAAGKTKTEIRDLTHLHHALDAATLGLAAHYLPSRNGAVWRAIAKRNKSPHDINLLTALKLIKRTADNHTELADIPPDVKNNLAARLAECRVTQHVPADRSGMPSDQNMWRLDGWGDDGKALLSKSSIVTIRPDGTRERKQDKPKAGANSPDRLIGWNSNSPNSKLEALRAVLITNKNFGLALDPEPTIIPFHQVTKRIAELKEANADNPVRIIRPGMLISITTNPPASSQDYTGLWRVASIKNNKAGPALDIIRPHYIKAQNRVAWSGMNKNIKPLLKAGLTIANPSLTGLPKAP